MTAAESFQSQPSGGKGGGNEVTRRTDPALLEVSPGLRHVERGELSGFRRRRQCPVSTASRSAANVPPISRASEIGQARMRMATEKITVPARTRRWRPRSISLAAANASAGVRRQFDHEGRCRASGARCVFRQQGGEDATENPEHLSRGYQSLQVDGYPHKCWLGTNGRSSAIHRQARRAGP